MLSLKIVSPERVEFEGEVDSVLVPGTIGQFEIFVNHAHIISSLEKGTVTYTLPGNKKQSLDVTGGFVEVRKNQVSVCVELN